MPRPGASGEYWGLAGPTKVAKATTPQQPAISTQPHALQTRQPQVGLETQPRGSSRGRHCMRDIGELRSQDSVLPSVP